jgi:hypothetical protein
VGIAPAVEELLPAAVEAAGPAPSSVGLMVVVGSGWPLVNGTSLSGVPVEKAGAPAVALAEGPSVDSGLRTLAIGKHVGIKDEQRIGVDVLIDNMHDTVGNEHVGHDNACRVDKNGSVRIDGNLEIATVACLKRSSVLQSGRIANGASYNMVTKHSSEILLRKTLERVPHRVEGLVGRSEDGDIRSLVNSVKKIGCVGSTAQ